MREAGDEDIVEALVAAVRRELTEAGALDSSLGQQALLIASRIGEAASSSLAPQSKELREIMAEATGSAQSVSDPLDELKLRRDRKSG